MKMMGNEVFLFTVKESEKGEGVVTIVPGRMDNHDQHIKAILADDISSLEILLYYGVFGFSFVPVFNIEKSGKMALDLDTLAESANYLRKIYRSLTGLKRRGITSAGTQLYYLAEELSFMAFYRSGNTKIPKSTKECVHMTGAEVEKFINRLVREFKNDRIKS